MSKNILVISSSPRKNGNSDTLCDEFVKGAKAAGHAAEKIRLSEKTINYCTGCCSCVGGTSSCIQNDDMAEIFDLVLAADVIVLATPVYFRSFNAQMKTFIDRICPIYARITDKDIYFIIAAAGGKFPVESTVDSFRVFTGCLGRIREKGVISITGVWDKGGVKGSPALRQAYEAGFNA